MKEKKFKNNYKNILLHIPHSSVCFPSDSRFNFNDLDEDERLLIDYYTDMLFMPLQPLEHISSMIFPYCRLFADVERLVDDPLEEEGLGISYRRQMSSGVFRAFSNQLSAFKLYVDFHAQVSIKLVELERPLLIDCHSFAALPNLLNSNPPNIDICIGYNDDETYPGEENISKIAQHFKACGYKVGINTPFSNSKTFAVPVKYHSVMIEVNKRLYMDELTLEKTKGFDKLRNEIQDIYSMLLSNN